MFLPHRRNELQSVNLLRDLSKGLRVLGTELREQIVDNKDNISPTVKLFYESLEVCASRKSLS